MKKILFFLSIVTLLTTGCRNRNVQRLVGSALGTTYSVTFVGAPDSDFPKGIDSVLQAVNDEFSIFDSNSVISRINKGDTITLSPDFEAVTNLALQVSHLTDGAFDCTLQPLIELWGFGAKNQKQIVPQPVIDSVKAFVGSNLIEVKNHQIVKKDSRVCLDFNAIAKGYAADKVSQYLEDKGIVNHLVEIGGEIVSHGTKKGKPWRIGIQVPTETADGAMESSYTFDLTDRAVATSGDYRNYFEENGIRYTHIIDPTTGSPKQSNLLSVTVIADNCATADALATAFMVLGVETSKALMAKQLPPDIEAYFIFADGEDFKTEKTEKFP